MKIKVVCACGEEVLKKEYLKLLWDMQEAGIIREIGPDTFEIVRSAETKRWKPFDKETFY
jgi:hypothetical protein